MNIKHTGENLWEDVDVLGKNYAGFLQELKKEIATARTKAHLAVLELKDGGSVAGGDT